MQARSLRVPWTGAIDWPTLAAGAGAGGGGAQRHLKPDIAAPGDGRLVGLPGGQYGLNSGTSMAGPHVAGVVALLWSADPSLIGDIDRTEQILATAQPFSGHMTSMSEMAAGAAVQEDTSQPADGPIPRPILLRQRQSTRRSGDGMLASCRAAPIRLRITWSATASSTPMPPCSGRWPHKRYRLAFHHPNMHEREIV